MPAPPQPQPVDVANSLLGETPAQMTAGQIQTAAGQRMALTIRTPSTTLTVLLGEADAKAWAAGLTAAAGQMSKSGLIIANGNVPR